VGGRLLEGVGFWSEPTLVEMLIQLDEGVAESQAISREAASEIVQESGFDRVWGTLQDKDWNVKHFDIEDIAEDRFPYKTDRVMIVPPGSR
jgi:hypothetical protein